MQVKKFEKIQKIFAKNEKIYKKIRRGKNPAVFFYMTAK